MEKVFKCQEDENDIITISSNDREKKGITITNYFDLNDMICVNLSKTDAIEFCRELLKHIATL
jgi:hypothetical protein